MRRRIIPVLLLRGRGLVKTVRFTEPSYVGDPINVVRIFNEKEVDEIVLFDITATREQRPPRFDLIAEIVSEAFMPVCYGGGVRTVEDARALLRCGVEKIAINAAARTQPGLPREIANRFGSQCVVGVIDVSRRAGQYVVYAHERGVIPEHDPVRWARSLEQAGVGELIVQCVDRDGTQSGLDLELARTFRHAVSVPVVLVGGARDVDDMRNALNLGDLSGIGVGARFVWYGPHRAVLVSYLSKRELATLLERAAESQENRV